MDGRLIHDVEHQIRAYVYTTVIWMFFIVTAFSTINACRNKQKKALSLLLYPLNKIQCLSATTVR